MLTPPSNTLGSNFHLDTHWFSCRNVIHLITVVAIILAQGCSVVPERNPVPYNDGEMAQISSITEARFWGDEPTPFSEDLSAIPKDELRAKYPAIFGTRHNYLALSGGGQDGAFGAGILVGWTEAGTRPEFTMVTGISTGALIAPFAFLGPEYDEQLKVLYTTLSTKDILKPHLATESVASSEPLQAILAAYIDEEMLQALKHEYRRGRRLLIGTTNIDAARPVTWDITVIADSGKPEALDLIRRIMLASASIPVAFPPVLFDLEIDGIHFDEMHVDGGVTSQIFLYPVGVDWPEVQKFYEVKGMPHAYVIRNAKLDPLWDPVSRQVIELASRSIASLLRTQGIGDMYRIALSSQRDGIDFNMTYIPDDFDKKSEQPFDEKYMNQLFNLGYQMAKSGYPWLKAPP